MKRLLILSNSIGGLYSFRKELIEKLLSEGYEVIISAPLDVRTSYFVQLGCDCIDTPINRRGINPLIDLKLILNYINLLKLYKPDIVLTYTIKPNVYGGLACRMLGIPYIANITGLGTSIENGGFLQKISLQLYKTGLKNASCVFFQNERNKNFFDNFNVFNGKSKLIPGSGVNLKEYSFAEYPKDGSSIRFLFIGRIMKAKGIDELLQAAEKIKEKYSYVQFDLVGRSEDDYIKILKRYEEKEVIKYHGFQSDVHAFIKKSHAIINPSYHEGMSNVLLESAATGRPVLASNIPGCRETFNEGISGIGFEVNVESLVNAIEKFINLPYDKKKQMGLEGRKKVENEFDRNIVVNDYIKEIKLLTSKGE